MEALTGIRQRQKPEDFPNRISPFPQGTDHLVFANPTAGAHSSPQKLRPIRSGSCRSPAVELPENAENLGDGCPVQVGSDSGTWEDEVEDESSSSPDDDCDGEDEHLNAQGTVPVNRKRKRRSSKEIDFKRVERFLASLVMRMMEKQERMHEQLMEMVEKREKDRMAREEAWKQQELDRLKRDKEIRAQETSRSLALISFIQEFVGHEIPVPQPAPTPSPSPATPAPVTAPMQSPLPLSVVSSTNNQRCTKQNGGADNGNQRNMMMMIKDGDSEIRRWPEAEVKALITLRGAAEHKFRYAGSAGSKVSIWEEISLGMHGMGYNRSAKKCKEKWENMNKYFKKSMVTEKKRSSNSKTRPYFLELEMLHRNGVVSSGNGLKYTNNQIESKTEKE